MARQSTAATRNLTLTEELEKLEQSITLTLQEIDHNFSRAHRIVTTSILPIVEQYAKHSEAVWEGSKFWKQFFEASANVSLSGYEDGAIEDSALAATQDFDASTTEGLATPGQDQEEGDEETITGGEEAEDERLSDDELLSSPSLTHNHSTPRQPSGGRGKAKQKTAPPPPSFADYPSPYEALKREVEGTSRSAYAPNPTTPGKSHALPDMSMTPDSSPFVLPGRDGAPGTASRNNKDTVLHQGILNKTYRVAATPHTARKAAAARAAATLKSTPGTANRGRSRWIDETLSSPDEPTPQLRAEIFSSPVRAPRTPGVSVQTPGLQRKLALAAKARAETAENGPAVQNVAETSMADVSRARHGDEPTSNFTRTIRARWESDDEDEDGGLGDSPAKTIQFDVPRQNLLQTPAREASRRIVEDLLLTAGGEVEEEWDLEEDDSPSIVKRNRELDETF